MEDIFIYIHDTHTVIHFVLATSTASICDGNIQEWYHLCTSSIRTFGKMTMTLHCHYIPGVKGSDTLQCSPRKITLQPQALSLTTRKVQQQSMVLLWVFFWFLYIDRYFERASLLICLSQCPQVFNWWFELLVYLGILDTTDISTREKHWPWIWLQFRLPLWLKICWVGVMCKIEPPAYCTPQIWFNEWIPPKCIALLYFNLSNEKNAGWLGYYIGDYATHLLYIGDYDKP